MSKAYPVRTASGVRQAYRHRVTDLMDLERFPAAFGRYKDLLGWKNEARAKAMAKELVALSIDAVMDRMIEEGDRFVLPLKDFGEMRIGDMASEASTSPARPLLTVKPSEHAHALTIKLSSAGRQRLFERRGTYFHRARLEWKHRVRIQEKLDNGMVYLPA